MVLDVKKSKAVHNWRNPMRRLQHVHFVGIGGVGMSGIAEVMVNLGYRISGSDLSTSATTERLRERGALIFLGHHAENIKDADVVVVSTAVANENPEVLAARENRIPVIPRAEMLAELMRFRQGIAIAGTHGKTTTTSLVATVLAGGGLDPTFVIGGKLNSVASHGKLGEGEYLVAEADESDASFLLLQPVISVVTNIDSDHLGTYENDFAKLKQAFVDFLHHLPFYGLAVLCIDDVIVREILDTVTRPVMTYAIDQAADLQAYNIKAVGVGTEFSVRFAEAAKDQYQDMRIRLNMPGRHNVLNALAAIGIAAELGIAPDAIQSALAEFAGVGRRFQIYGDLKFKTGTALMIDDYGHHPREMQATISAARESWPTRRLVVAFQPHRYTRTHDLFEDFCSVLATVDALCLCEVYSAGEAPIAGADGRALCGGIRARGKVNPVFVENFKQLPEILFDLLQPNDVLLMLGAGNIGSISADMQTRFQEMLK